MSVDRVLKAMLLSLSIAAPARAAGLFVAERGVRPLARGGAFVAGADDAGAIAYNPAGLSFASHHILVDGAWLQYRSRFQRSTLVRQTDPATGESRPLVVQDPAVEGTSPFAPIPTVAYATPVSDTLSLGVGVWAPYAALSTYPESVDGRPAPQRYSLLSNEGSALAIFGVYGAYRASKTLALGAGVEVLGGALNTTVVLNACPPDRLVCAPEQPDYDVPSRLRVGPILAPSGVIGVIWVPDDVVRVGASFHLPWYVSAPATVDVTLPSTPLFQGARQVGREADVRFDLPWTARAGVEIRPAPETRIETDVVYEAWHMHDAIVLEPRHITLEGFRALPGRYSLLPVRFPREFTGAGSLRLGGEQTVRAGETDLIARAGVAFETSAVPEHTLNVSALDLHTITLGFGLGVRLQRVRLDLLAARVVGLTRIVAPGEAAVHHVYPLRANPPEDAVAVNGGRYEVSANIFGLGVAYNFDPPVEAQHDEREGRPEWRH